jgi:outer membrane protein
MKALVLILSLGMNMSAWSADVIGLVDVQRILTTIKEGQNVAKQLEKTYNEKKSQLKKEEDKLKKMDEDLKKQAALLSDQAKMTKGRELQELALKLQEKSMQYQKDMQKQEQDLKKPILDKLRPIIDEVSKSSAVSMTFELSSAPILYAENKKDLTEEIIKAYDKKYTK